jgi:hypothetical protein
MECCKLTLKVTLQLVMVQQPDHFLIPYNTIEDGDCHKTSLLPNKSLDLWKAPRKADMKIIDEE